MKLVVDNSVAMRWLFADGSMADRHYASEMAAMVETSEVHVPALFVTEAANVISRALKLGVITPQECESRFDLLHAMPCKQALIQWNQSMQQCRWRSKHLTRGFQLTMPAICSWPKNWVARLQRLTRTYVGLQKIVAFRLPGILHIKWIDK